LPAKAIDLREFLRKYKEKDESKEFNIEEKKKGAFEKRDWARTFIPVNEEGQDKISAWMLADTEVYNSYQRKRAGIL
jgi:hypothetical protein